MRWSVFAVLLSLAVLETNKVDCVDLAAACENKLTKVDGIKQMLDVITELKKIRCDPDKRAAKSYARCLEEFDSIDELSDIIADTKNVCSSDHIDRMVQYHRAFLKISMTTKATRLLRSKVEREKMSRHFFRHYAMEVAYLCRTTAFKNLVKSGINEEDLETALTILKEINDRPDTDIWADIDYEPNPIDLFRIALKSIKSVDDIIIVREGSVRDKKVKKVSAEGEQPSTGDDDNEDDELDELTIETNAFDFERLKVECPRLKRFYDPAIISVVKLSELGYHWHQSKADEFADLKPNQRIYLRKWLAITQVCETIPVVSFTAPRFGDGFDPVIFIGTDMEDKFRLSRDQIRDGAKAKFGLMYSGLKKKMAGSMLNYVNSLAEKGTLNKIADKRAILELETKLQSHSGYAVVNSFLALARLTK